MGYGRVSVQGGAYVNCLGWTIFHLDSTNGLLFPCRGTISGTGGSFQLGAFADWRALTIESLLMSGCGQGPF